MSEGNVQIASLAKNKFALHAAICAGIFAVITIGAVFSSKVHLGFFGYIAMFLSGSIFTTIGVVVGDFLRNMAMPDFYTTRGFMDSIKKRIFWAIGPQAIGWLIGMMAMNGFMQNYLGYNMKTGAPQQAAATEPDTRVMDAVTAPVDLATLEAMKGPQAASEPASPPRLIGEVRIQDGQVKTVAGVLSVGSSDPSGSGPKALMLNGSMVNGTEDDNVDLVALYRYEGEDVAVFTHACNGSSCGFTSLALLKLTASGEMTIYRDKDFTIAMDGQMPALKVDEGDGIRVAFEGYSGPQTWRYLNGELWKLD